MRSKVFYVSKLHCPKNDNYLQVMDCVADENVK